MTALDIFGNPVDLSALANAPFTGKRKRKTPVPHGHFFTPGTGPESETCGSCKHIHHRQMAKVYLKCGLNQANWTGGHATDIRARDAACRHWEAKDGD